MSAMCQNRTHVPQQAAGYWIICPRSKPDNWRSNCPASGATTAPMRAYQPRWRGGFGGGGGFHGFGGGGGFHGFAAHGLGGGGGFHGFAAHGGWAHMGHGWNGHALSAHGFSAHAMHTHGLASHAMGGRGPHFAFRNLSHDHAMTGNAGRIAGHNFAKHWSQCACRPQSAQPQRVRSQPVRSQQELIARPPF